MGQANVVQWSWSFAHKHSILYVRASVRNIPLAVSMMYVGSCAAVTWYAAGPWLSRYGKKTNAWL